MLRDVCNLTIGTTLWRAGRRGRCAGAAQPVGALEAGAARTSSSSNLADPALAGQAADDVLDAAIFGPRARRFATSHGRRKWIVRDGRHHAEEGDIRPLRAALARMDASR